jgi:hypothetical protein
MNLDQTGGAILLAIGTGGLAYCVWAAFEGIKAMRWPRVKGRITSATMEESPSSRLRTWEPKVTYAYDVTGTPHTGSRISFGDGSTYSLTLAEATLDRYPLGRYVTVFYHPVDPSRSVLEPGVRGALLLSVALFTLTVLVALDLLRWL